MGATRACLAWAQPGVGGKRPRGHWAGGRPGIVPSRGVGVPEAKCWLTAGVFSQSFLPQELPQALAHGGQPASEGAE